MWNAPVLCAAVAHEKSTTVRAICTSSPRGCSPRTPNTPKLTKVRVNPFLYYKRLGLTPESYALCYKTRGNPNKNVTNQAYHKVIKKEVVIGYCYEHNTPKCLILNNISLMLQCYAEKRVYLCRDLTMSLPASASPLLTLSSLYVASLLF